MICNHDDGRAAAFETEPPHVPCPPELGSPLYERLRKPLKTVPQVPDSAMTGAGTFSEPKPAHGPINVAAARNYEQATEQSVTRPESINSAPAAAPDTHDFREYRERDRPDWDMDIIGRPLKPGV
jgi:hypothetical protein